MKKTLTFAAALALLGGAAQAAEHEVKMLNRGETGVMVFEPALLNIEPATPSPSSRPIGHTTPRRLPECCLTGPSPSWGR